MGSIFNGVDINGVPAIVEEMWSGPEIALIKTSDQGGVVAIRISSSTYIGTNGKVYAMNVSKAQQYNTLANLAWAKKELTKCGHICRY